MKIIYEKAKEEITLQKGEMEDMSKNYGELNEQYQKLSERVRKYSKQEDEFKSHTETLNEALQVNSDLNEHIRQLRTQNDGLEGDKKTLQKRVDNQKFRLSYLCKQLKNESELLAASKQECSSLRRQKEALDGQIGESGAMLAQIKESLVQKDSLIQTKDGEISRLKEEIERAQIEATGKDQVISELENKIALKEFESKSDKTLGEKVKSLEDQVAELFSQKQELLKSQSMMQNDYQGEIHKLKNESKRMMSMLITSFKTKFDQMRACSSKVDHLIASVSERTQSFDSKLDALNLRIRSLQKASEAIRKLKEVIEAQKSEIENLKQMPEEMDKDDNLNLKKYKKCKRLLKEEMKKVEEAQDLLVQKSQEVDELKKELKKAKTEIGELTDCYKENSYALKEAKGRIHEYKNLIDSFNPSNMVIGSEVFKSNVRSDLSAYPKED